MQRIVLAALSLSLLSACDPAQWQEYLDDLRTHTHTGTATGTGTSTSTGTVTQTATDTSTDTGTTPAKKTKLTVWTRQGTTQLINGQQSVFSFSVTADRSGEACIKRMTFERHINDASVVLYALYRNGYSAGPVTMSDGPNGELVADVQGAMSIFAGDTSDFELRAMVTGVKAGSSLTFRLKGDSDGSSNFLWSDMSAIPHSFTSDDWYNGQSVEGLPTAYMTLSM